MEKYTMNRRIVHFLYGIGKYKLHCTTPSLPQFHQASRHRFTSPLGGAEIGLHFRSKNESISYL
jgi:hypothetical protein